MFIYKCLAVLLFACFAAKSFSGNGSDNNRSLYTESYLKDTLKDNLSLYNGKLWINSYYKIKGDPFFLAAEFLSGSVSFNGKVYPAQKLKYDIYNDEIILLVNPVTTIILNKEMVDSVTLNYQNKTYKVVNQGDDSTSVVKGLVNIYYNGPTTLLVKFRKVIDLLAVDKRYDLFYQIHKIYIKKDDKIFLVSGRRDLLKILEDKAPEIKDYIKVNKLVVMRKEPESFIPVIRYYDSLKQ